MKSFITNFLSVSAIYFGQHAGAAASPSPPPPTAKIANGTVYGVHSNTYNQDFFLSIPYAQPPVGNLRFRPPQYIKEKRDFQANTYGPHCYGYGGDQKGYEVSEDCLTLNIVRPIIKTGAYDKLPVALWIHGGGFVMGGANDRRYNLTFIVEQSVKLGTPMIAVSINYRVAGWGFLSGREVAGTKNLNVGLKDQRMALHWIQENIQAFGGDPKKVTIFGESAGGFSVGLHQVAFDGRDDGLFRGTIMQSGSPIWYTPMAFPDTFQANYDALLKATGCATESDTLQCLRQVDVKRLNKALNTTNALVFGPVVDGEFISSLSSQAIKEGRYVKIPTIIGTTSDEGASFGQLGLNTTEEIRSFLGSATNYQNKTINRLLELYDTSVSVPPAENFTHPDEGTKLYGKQYHRVAAIVGDVWFIAGKRYVAQALSSKVPTWAYRVRTAPNGFAPWLRAPHFSEVAFVFYNLKAVGYQNGVEFTGETKDPLGGPNAAEYKKLADFMSKSWIRFVVSGDPSEGASEKDVKWLKYQDGSGKSQIVFDIYPNGTYMETDDYRKDGMELIMNSMLQNGV
ncbi:Acetylcholinesterase [Dactylellina cionopaga]|nr:Acetylcholinesterase [Dactylellina cionopaga]